MASGIVPQKPKMWKSDRPFSTLRRYDTVMESRFIFVLA